MSLTNMANMMQIKMSLLILRKRIPIFNLDDKDLGLSSTVEKCQ